MVGSARIWRDVLVGGRANLDPWLPRTLVAALPPGPIPARVHGCEGPWFHGATPSANLDAAEGI
eukprot:5319426-Alexandrium_andersonii.AAC.1